LLETRLDSSIEVDLSPLEQLAAAVRAEELLRIAMGKEKPMAEFMAEVFAEIRARGGPQTPEIRAQMIADGTIKYLSPNFTSPQKLPRPHLRLVL
jgi:hypothetical protein